MIESVIDGIESLRVMRSEGNCAVVGGSAGAVKILCDHSPEVRRSGALAEVFLPGDAALEVPPAVAIEVLDCAGNLEIEGFIGNLALGRVSGNLELEGVGSVSIRGKVDGNCTIRGAEAIEGEQVEGNLKLERVRSLALGFLAGNLECNEIQQTISVDEVGGKCQLEEVGGKVKVATIGGKLMAERTGAIECGRVAGKTRISECRGEVAIEIINGKLLVDGADGSVKVGSIDGQAALRMVAGDVVLGSIRGAVNLRGRFPAGRSWRVKSDGRISVEFESGSSVELEAQARFGRVRVYGLDGDLHWSGYNRLAGKIGGGQCKLVLETTGADIILEGEEMASKERDNWHRREFGWGRRFGAPFESLAENLSEEIPEFVSEIVGAAGKFVSDTGALSGGLVREVARGVGEGLREVERSLKDLERAVPEGVARKLAQLGRQIRDLVGEAVQDGRSYSRDAASRARERVRQTAEDLRREMREAVREAREGWHDADPGEAASEAHSPDPAPQARAARADQEIINILQAVKAGKLTPEEADDLIKAWTEVKEGNRPA